MSTLFCAPDLEVLTESSKNRDSSASAVDELNRASSTSMLQGSCSTAKTKGFQPIFEGSQSHFLNDKTGQDSQLSKAAAPMPARTD